MGSMVVENQKDSTSSSRPVDFSVEVGQIRSRHEAEALAECHGYPIMICPHRHVRHRDCIVYNKNHIGIAFHAAEQLSPETAFLVFVPKK